MQIRVRLCIPPFGARLVLAEPWTFMLFQTRGSLRLVKALDKSASPPWPRGRIPSSDDLLASEVPIVIPKDTTLTIDIVRVDRHGYGYSHIGFKVKKGESPDRMFWSTRFIARLEDVNRMVCLPARDEAVEKAFKSYAESP